MYISVKSFENAVTGFWDADCNPDRFFLWLTKLGLLPAAAFATGADNVYISVSFDGRYINDKNGNAIAYIPESFENLASVDLDEYGLSEYKYDEGCSR